MDTSRPVPAPRPPISSEIQIAELRHELANDRRIEVRDAHKRARIHMLWLTLGGTISLILFIVHMYLASASATGVAPLLAEMTVMIRRR